MKRLIDKYARLVERLAYHDTFNRDYAICYIDGEIVKGHTHGEAINNYLQEKTNGNFPDLGTSRPPINVDEKYLMKADKDLKEQLRENIKQVGFAHVVEDDKAIYIEDDSLFNIDLNTVAQAMKAKYPDYDVYDDKAYDDHDSQKVAKRK